jgi:hypothetical protein
MHLTCFTDPAAFATAVAPFLERTEPEHALLLGILGQLRAGTMPTSAGPLMAAVTEGDEVILAAVHTPPFPLLLSLGRADAAAHLATALAERGHPVERANGPGELSATFAQTWSRATGVHAEPTRRLRAHALERVEPTADAPGCLRAARSEDAPTVLAFWQAFELEADTPSRHPERAVERGIAERRIVVWDDGEVVSMAQSAGPTPHGIRISLVYTPPARRGRGYATSCVAALTRQLLAAGRRYCFLFTDVENPISNRIYARIGYRPVCDFTEHAFVGGSAAE